MNEINKLALIADELDSQGLTKAADAVTEVMRRISQQIPQDVAAPVEAPTKTLNPVGQYDESAWKQTFTDKYNRFVKLVENTKNVQLPMDANNISLARGLYDEMMYIASNYLKDDAEVFQAMKWAAPTYKGIFG